MSDLFNLYVKAGSPNGDDQPQSAHRWAADEIARLRADHQRLVEALGKMHAIAEFRESRNHEVIAAGELLAALEAEKGGGL